MQREPIYATLNGKIAVEFRKEQMPLNGMLERLGSWNTRMNGLPRKGMLVATTPSCSRG